MRRSYVLPLGVLAVILAFCMWNARSMTGCTDRWSGQLSRVEALAAEDRWQDAGEALEESYADWQHFQTYLHRLPPRGGGQRRSHVPPGGGMRRRA